MRLSHGQPFRTQSEIQLAAVASVTPGSDPYTNALLGNYRWASGNLSYSFPTTAGVYGSPYGSNEPLNTFGVLNGTQQNVARAAFANYAAVANVVFSEFTAGSTGSATLRLAMSNAPNTAWAYLPSTPAEGGDVWFNNSGGYYNNPVKGNYAYATFLHEIGHAMGLEHPHENYMPLERDSMDFTVMSYRSYVGASTSTGYVNENWGFAQSLMMQDIAAVQLMYGANFNTNNGNTTYSWNPGTGQMSINGVGQATPGGNRIFETVWDGGGVDTYDFSNYATNLNVDLRPGQWSTLSDSQLARLHYNGSQKADGNVANALQYNGDARSLIENAAGGSGNDTMVGNDAANVLWGNAGNDTIQGGGGNDTLHGGNGDDALDGGAGTNTVVLRGNYADYVVSRNSGGDIVIRDTVANRDAMDTIKNVQSFQFSDNVFTTDQLLLGAGGATLVLSEFGSDAGWTSNDRTPRRLADVNGDGFDDIVGFKGTGVYVALGNASGFAPSTLESLDFGQGTDAGWGSDTLYPRELADIDGDGRADIVGFGAAGVYVALGTAAGSFGAATLVLQNFGTAAGGWSNTERYPRKLADVNGDDRADIVGFGEFGAIIALGNASGSFDQPVLALSNFGVSAGGWYSNDRYPRELADANGDGLADIVGFGEFGVIIAFGNASGSFDNAYLALGNFGVSAGGWGSNSQYPRQLTDVNGDGRADVIGFGEYGVISAAASGSSFAAAQLSLDAFGRAYGWLSQDQSPRYAGDFDGDGDAEAIGFGQLGVYVADFIV